MTSRFLNALLDPLVWQYGRAGNTDEIADPRDPLMLAYWEQVLNGLVYELFFRDELHVHGIHVFNLVADACLPDINTLPENKRLSVVRAQFERLYAAENPLRGALSTLRSLEIVRTIEGES
jgi:adenine-specific DNA-methyltransferase